ncbi:hypothetical protein A2335_01305 [Candidatus Peregrinibacteria bacterium RIFOXYB2_FULL_32_7]|nr:MAG: hypothetical protein A2335_01305 [Candidatus Peregrinibacteria bacterium RIFOXYB2_FULL_32_7]
MKEKFFKYINSVPYVLISGFLFLSLFWPTGNKFDVGRSISLTLLFGIITLSISGWQLIKTLYHVPARLIDFWQKLFLFGFVSFSIISFFLSQTANFGFTEVLMMLGGVLIFLSVNFSLLNEESLAVSANRNSRFQNWKILYTFSVFLAIFVSLWGYVLYFVSHHNRAFGLFYNPELKSDAWPNAFALFILLLWPIVFYWFVKKNNKEKRKKWMEICFVITKYLGFSLILATFVLTFSRAGMIAFGGQIMLFIGYIIWTFCRDALQCVFTKCVSTKCVFMKKIILLIIITFFLIQIAQFGRSYSQNSVLEFSDRAQFQNGEQITSIQERIDFWKGALELTKKEPWFGYGPMSFSFVYRSIQKDWLSIADHPHNWFLKISSESGIPATIFFILFLASVFFKILKNFRNLDDEKKFIVAVLSISILGAIAHNLVDFNMNFATNFVIFWVILAILNNDIFVETHFVETHCNVSLRKIIFVSIFIATFFFTICGAYYTNQSFIGRKAFINKNFAKAEKYLNISYKTPFPRYLFWEKAAEAIKIGDFQSAEIFYQKQIKINPWDAMTYNLLGELYFYHFNYKEKALENFTKALSLDPKNNWIYYLNYAKNLESLGKISTLKIFSEQVLKELKQYLPKVEQNLHYTAQTENPKKAITLLNILIKYDGENRNEYFNLRNKIKTAIKKYQQ